MLRVAWLVPLGLVACGGSGTGREATVTDEPERELIAHEEACDRDEECVITDAPTCCECCGCVVPYAIRADALEAERSRCESADCAATQEELGCAVEECLGCPLTEEHFVAICDQGRCTRR